MAATSAPGSGAPCARRWPTPAAPWRPRHAPPSPATRRGWRRPAASLRAALFRGSFAATLDAVDRGDAAAARDWLLLREFRTATRFTRPGADATLALDAARRPAGSRAARRATAVAQGPARRLPGAAARAARRRRPRRRSAALPVRRAEAAAQAEGYFAILAARYAQDRAPRRRRVRRPRSPRLRGAALAGGERFLAARSAAAGALDGLHRRAVHRRGGRAPRPAAAALPRAGAGRVRPRRPRTRRVTLDFEIQEAVAFRTGAQSALRRPARPAGQARPRTHRRGRARARPARAPSSTRPRSATRACASADEVRALTSATEDAPARGHARRRGRRRPTSPTTT